MQLATEAASQYASGCHQPQDDHQVPRPCSAAADETPHACSDQQHGSMQQCSRGRQLVSAATGASEAGTHSRRRVARFSISLNLRTPILLCGLLLVGLLTAAAVVEHAERHTQKSHSSSSLGSWSITGLAAVWYGGSPVSSKQPTASQWSVSQPVNRKSRSFSRSLLGSWNLLGIHNSFLSGGILQQLLSAANQEDEQAASAAKAAANTQGRASQLMLADLYPSSSNSGSNADRAPARFLATAAQGPSSNAGQGLLPIGTDAQPLCSATINYGASVGDASKKATADVPIYVGSFDVVVTQPQAFQATPLPEGQNSRWVLGWQFTAGEYLQLSRDVFGDEGIQEVYLSPSAQADAGPEAPAAALPGKGPSGQTPQRVAVFSNTSLDGSNAEVVFSFVGRKGPAQPLLPNAPFRVAPPASVFLNNHYCWPLFRPQGSSGSGPAAVAAAAGSGVALVQGGAGAAAGKPATEAGQQQQMVEVATPRLSAAEMPRQLQVEYLPVEFSGETEDPALFAKTVTQFYFKITNSRAEGVYLDQLLLQYWFHGPLDSTPAEPAASNDSSSAGPGVTDVVAQVLASQFRLTCSDASPELGCGGLAWNVTPGLPSAFGARFILNIWFPAPDPANATAGSDRPQRYVLLPSNSTSAAASNASMPLERVNGPDGKPLLLQPMVEMQAIVAIEPRRFFANISASNDYSFENTPVLTQPGSNSSAGGQGQLVRRRREANPRMPAYIAQQLAWGSPPKGSSMAPRPGPAGSSAAGKSAFPPGSYCQPSPGGGLVCGIDVLYCCLGSTPLNLNSVPADWPSRLTGGNGPSNVTDPSVGRLTPTPDTNVTQAGASSSSSSGIASWALALAVALPVAALLVAVCGGLALVLRRRRKRAKTGQFKPFGDSSSSKGSQGGEGDALTDLRRPLGPQGSVAWAPAAAAAGADAAAGGAGSWQVPLLSTPQQYDPAGWGAGEREQGTSYALQQQQLADWQLIHQQQQLLDQQGAASSHDLGALQQDQQAPAGAVSPQRQLLRVLKPKAPSLPGDVIAAAARFARQQPLLLRQLMQGPTGSRPGSALAQGSQQALQDLSDSALDSDASESSVRCHTWTGRMHEDAFHDDVLDQLLNLHMRPQLLSSAAAAAAPSSPTTTDQVWQQLQLQQAHPQPNPGAGAAAAAVEAAVTAINALLSGTEGSPRPPTPARSRCPPGRKKSDTSAAAAAAAAAAEAAGGSSSNGGGLHSPPEVAPSFYKALMATGGVLRPAGGPPIPLNVNYAAEIQPNLGRLLGRGGFGHVYEGTWRGQRVAVKLLTVDTEDPAVLDAFLKEVALCACLRGCDRVVRLLGACLGGSPSTAAAVARHTPAAPAPHGGAAAAPPGSSYHTGSTASVSTAAAAAAAAAAGPGSPVNVLSMDVTPFQSQLPPDVLADDTPPNSGGAAQQQPQQQWALIMELVEGGNLAHRIYHPSKRSLSYLEILQVGLDIVSGLAYLHPAVVHRDLKPQNVLLDRHGRAKIADFGISRFKDPHRSYLSVTHQGGTPNYMAPELFNASRVDEAADVYSLGCILYECVARQQPFGHLADEGKSFNVLFKIIVAVAINKERPPLPHDTPPRLASLILRCWSENPAGRPRVNQLLAELSDMMREALQERAERTGRLHRINSRSQSLPNQPLHVRNNSVSSIASNTSSSGGGSSSPSRRGVVRGAHTMPVAPSNSLASSAAAVAGGSDSAANTSLWPIASDSHGSAVSAQQHSNAGSGISTMPSGVAPAPYFAAGAIATAAKPPASSSSSARSIQQAIAAVSASRAASIMNGEQCSASLRHTEAATALPVFTTALGTHSAAGSRRTSSSSSSCLEAQHSAGPSSPHPFQDQPHPLLQAQEVHLHHPQHPQHLQQQQQQLGRCGSLASSGCSRANWHCTCCGSPEPCAACAGSSSDGGSSSGGCGGSGGSGASFNATPTSIIPQQLSPPGGRQLHILPQIPQESCCDTPMLPLQLPTAGTPHLTHSDSTPRPQQLHSLQPTLPHPKASVAGPQTPSGNAHIGRKPSHLSSQASGPALGALLTHEGSLPVGALGPRAGSTDLQYTSPAPAAATAYPALLYPLHSDNLAAATAAAFGQQPAATLQQQQGAHAGSGSSGSSGSRSGPQSQQQGLETAKQTEGCGPLPRQRSAALPLPPAAALLRQQSGGGPTVGGLHNRSSSMDTGSSSQQYRAPQPAGSSSVLRPAPWLNPPPSDPAGAGQQQREQRHQQQQQQHSRGGEQVRLLHAASLPPSLARSTSSVPSEQTAAGELSSSQSSSPSAVTGCVGAASLYSCSSGISSGTSRLRSASMDFSCTSMYTNPLFGLPASEAWQPPVLQMQHSDPTMARSGSSRLSAAARSRSAAAAVAATAAAAAAAAAAGTGVVALLDVSGHSRGTDSSSVSNSTVFHTATSHVHVSSGSSSDANPASSTASAMLGDFSVHRRSAQPSLGAAAAVAAGSAGSAGDVEVVSGAAAAVARKVSFADEDRVLG